jgi:acyltransferase
MPKCEGPLYLKHQFTIDGLWNLLWGGNHLGRPFFAFWFVTALFVAAIVHRLMQNFPVWVPWAMALCGLGVVYWAGPALANVPLSAGVAWPSLIFVLAGVAFRKMRSRIDLGLKAGLALFAVGALLAGSGVAAPLDMKQADFGTPTSVWPWLPLSVQVC